MFHSSASQSGAPVSKAFGIRAGSPEQSLLVGGFLRTASTQYVLDLSLLFVARDTGPKRLGTGLRCPCLIVSNNSQKENVNALAG